MKKKRMILVGANAYNKAIEALKKEGIENQDDSGFYFHFMTAIITAAATVIIVAVLSLLN